MSGFPPPDPTTADPDTGLHRRLVALAATLPQSHDRVAGVAARARRRHRRQAALRSGAALACAGAVVGGLLAVRGGRPSNDGPVGASETTVATTPATTVPVNVAADCPAPPPIGAGGGVGTGGAEIGVSVGGGPGKDAGTTMQLKAIGTVMATDDASITVEPDRALPDGTVSITASITDATEFYDNGIALTERPALAVGDRVVIGVRTDDGAPPVVEFVMIHADEPAPATVADDGVIKGADGSVTIHVGGGSGGIDGALSVVAGDGKVTCVTAGVRDSAGAPVDANSKP